MLSESIGWELGTEFATGSSRPRNVVPPQITRRVAVPTPADPVRNLYTDFGHKTVTASVDGRKVVEIERIALDVVSCGHVSQDDDLAVDNLETSGGWNELEPRFQEIGPALPLEDDLFLFTQNQKKDLHLGSITRRNSRESETRFAVRKETELRTFRADGRDVPLSPA